MSVRPCTRRGGTFLAYFGSAGIGRFELNVKLLMKFVEISRKQNRLAGKHKFCEATALHYQMQTTLNVV